MQMISRSVIDQKIDMVFKDADTRGYFYQGIEALHFPEESTTQEIEETIDYFNSIKSCPACKGTNISWRDNWVRCTGCGEVLVRKDRLYNTVVSDEANEYSGLYKDLMHIDPEHDLSDLKVPELSTAKIQKLKNFLFSA